MNEAIPVEWIKTWLSNLDSWEGAEVRAMLKDWEAESDPEALNLFEKWKAQREGECNGQR